MDLHVIGPLASPAERAAVDAVLGPPATRWVGGERTPGTEGHVAHGGHAARSRRDLLLPVLHAVQDRIGWISQPAINYICKRLTIPPAEAYGVASFYALYATKRRPPVVAHVCDDIACRVAGAEDLITGVERALGAEGEPIEGARATWLRSPCMGRCERAPAALLTVAGEGHETMALGPIDAAGVVSRVEAAVAGRHVVPEDHSPKPSPERLVHLRRSMPQAGDDGLTLLRRVGRVDPTSLDDYRTTGGYEALAAVLERGPAWAIDEVTASGLLGRGGAAFPTGRKWSAVAAATSRPKYVVCNADESEPGTFKDRAIMEEDPFTIVEAMTIEGFVVGASKGFLYVRGEYPLCEQRMRGALDTARAAGLLGDDILGSDFSFDIELRRGAGAYICGEETALFESIEGKRGEPRNKPPFPVEVGLFGKPTAVNNIETLVNVPWIILNGGAAFAAIGTPGSTGPKLFCVSGTVARPGIYEVTFGTTLGELVTLAGGVAADRALKAVLLGGAAGVFVGPESLELPLTFEATRAAGATLGSGVVMVFDETVDLVGILARIARFFRDESCGQCVPCRVGTQRQEELLARLAARSTHRSRDEELVLLREMGQAMRDASICGLGQTASAAIESAFRQPGLVAL